MLLSTLLLFLLCLATVHSQDLVHGDCSDVYQKDSENCADNCGRCFNPNGRSTVPGYDVTMCQGQPGYYCNPEGDAFACMDWTFGSNKMKELEEEFNSQNNENVWFGVGTFGTQDDPLMGLGACYRLSIRDTNCGDIEGGEPLERHVIAQSINTGHDVANIQFDLQMGNGGTGAFNNCAGKGWSLFPGAFTEDVWGAEYGGCNYRDASEGSPSCDDLPPLPQVPGKMQEAGDTLVDMCKYSFDQRVRKGPQNPTIVDMARVKCPAGLTDMTQIKRTDDPNTFSIEEANRPTPYQNGAPDLKSCRCSCGAMDCKYCLTRMMDCRKPSAGFIDNLGGGDLFEDGFKVLQPCTADGYTRIDVKCGCFDCYC